MVSIKSMFLCAAAVIVPLGFAAPAFADDANAASAAGTSDKVPDIIVTAQKRAEKLQDVPITITALGGKALADANVTGVQALTSLVSGFVGPGTIAMQSPHLRGVGSQVSSPGLENSVALYVDGIYIGATSPALLKLSDVANVEVLKGPQGTLFGRNTTGGLVQIQTRNPSQAQEVDAELGYANFDTLSGSLYGNLPISADIATNLAVQVSGAGKGWGTNFDTGTPTSQLKSEIAIRNKWDVSLGDGTRFMVMGDYEHHSDLGYFNSRPVVGTVISSTYTSTVSGWDANSASNPRVLSDAYGLAGKVTHDFSFGTLTNTLAYRDTTFKLLDFTANYAPSGEDSIHFFWNTQNRQLTNELQLSSNGHDKLQWTLGMFYYRATDINHQPAETGLAGPPFNFVTDSVVKTESVAGYGQASYEFMPGTTLTAGLRFSRDHHAMTGTFVVTDLSGGHFPFLPPNDVESVPAFSHDSLSARVSLAHKFSDDMMIYASYNRGSKSGGFNPVTINNAPFADEKIDAYEVGMKLSGLDKTLRFDLSGFYYQYSNIQLNSFYIPGPPRIYNGPSAKLYGIDADIEFRPTSALTISGNLEYLHSEFGYFPSAELYVSNYPSGGASIVIGSATGNQLPLAPSFTASVSANYQIPTSMGNWNLNGNYAYNGGFYTTAGNELHQNAFGRLGASVQFTTLDERYSVRVWGANLTNTQSATLLNYLTSGPIVKLDAPRTFGVTLGAKFK